MPERYSSDNPLAGLGFLLNALGGGGDTGQIFPQSDAEDMSCGARFIPGEVTLARRRGQIVTFVDTCGPCCWYWQMPGGSRIYHFERFTYNNIGRQNLGTEWDEAKFSGSCPQCGNPFTRGGTITPKEVAAGAYTDESGG